MNEEARSDIPSLEGAPFDLVVAILEAASNPLLLIERDRRLVLAANAAARRLLGPGLASEHPIDSLLPELTDQPLDRNALLKLPGPAPRYAMWLPKGAESREGELRAGCEATPVAWEVVALEWNRDEAEGRDPLTGLAMRGVLMRRMQLLRNGPASVRLGLFFIDLDHFKQINDRWGHSVGDQVLQVVGRRLRACFRPSDLVSRFGGDEFVAILAPCEKQDAEWIARRIGRSIGESMNLRTGQQIEISASLGVALGSPGDLDAMLENADQAMYQAKRQGRGRHVTAPAATHSPLTP